MDFDKQQINKQVLKWQIILEPQFIAIMNNVWMMVSRVQSNRSEKETRR